MEIFIFIVIIFIIILWSKNSSLKKRVDDLESKVLRLDIDLNSIKRGTVPKATPQTEPTPHTVPHLKPETIPEPKDIPKSGGAFEPQPAVKPHPPFEPQPTIIPGPKTEPRTELKPQPVPEPKPEIKPQTVTPLPTAKQPVTEKVNSAAFSVPKPKVVPPKPPVAEPRKPSQFEELRKKLEKQFIENWTGILGSIIMVIGVGFLSIYAALKVTPVWRFALITTISAALFGIYLFLHSKDKWLKLATWLRSSGGAIFLFGCLGSGGVPGLKWIDERVYALGLLCLGIAVNLFLGYAGKTQVFASLHVVLSLAALSVAPSAPMTLYIAALVSFIGVLLTLRAKWEYHLFVTLTAFFSFHLYWYISMGLHDHSKITLALKLSGIAVTVLIGITGALIHYRKLYQTKGFESLPFIVHMLNVFYFAIGLMFYSTGSKWNTVVLAVAAIATFFLARHARTLNIRWLYITDTLIAQTITLFAIYTLTRWKVDAFAILGFAWIETFVFLVVMLREEDSFLRKAGLLLEQLMALAIVTAPLFFLDFGNVPLMNRRAIILAVELLIFTLFHFHMFKNYGEAIDSVNEIKNQFSIPISFNGILVGVLAFTTYLHIFQYEWAPYPLAVIAIILLLLRSRYQMNGLAIGLLLMTTAVHIVGWYQLYVLQDKSIPHIILYGLPFFFISYTIARTANVEVLKKNLNLIGAGFFSVHFVLFTFFLFQQYVFFSIGSNWYTFGVMVAGVMLYLIARWARSLKLRGLYITDILVSQFIIITGIITLRLWNFSSVEIAGCIWGETILFLLLMLREEDAFLKRIGLIFHQFAGFALLVVPLFSLDFNNQNVLTGSAAIMAIELVVLITFHLYLFKRYTEKLDSISEKSSSNEVSFNGILTGILGLLAFIFVFQFYWSPYAATAAVIILLFLRAKFNSNGIGIGTTIFMIGVYLLGWVHLFELRQVGMPEIAVYGLPFFFISYAALRSSYVESLKKSITSLPIYLLTIHLILYTYLLFNPVLPFIPGVLWLVLSVIYLECSLGVTRKYANADEETIKKSGASNKHLMFWARLFLIMFLIRHILVHLQTESYLAGFKTRLLIEIFALMIAGYWALIKKPILGPKQEKVGQYPTQYLFPMMWEVFLGFYLFTLFMEVSSNWMPLVWVITSFVLMGVGYIPQLEVSRFRFYSLLFYWAAAFHIAFISSSLPTPTNAFLETAWVKGLIGIIMLYGFIIFFYKKSPLENIIFPPHINGLIEWIEGIREKKNRWIYYPYFLSIAVFLYWTFSHSLLTLLWVVEAFFIFVLSIILKENQFRYVSYLGLLGCLVRLMVYDLGRSGTLTRALVFLGVGVLMLIMNTLYNKFKERM